MLSSSRLYLITTRFPWNGGLSRIPAKLAAKLGETQMCVLLLFRELSELSTCQGKVFVLNYLTVIVSNPQFAV